MRFDNFVCTFLFPPRSTQEDEEENRKLGLLTRSLAPETNGSADKAANLGVREKTNGADELLDSDLSDISSSDEEEVVRKKVASLYMCICVCACMIVLTRLTLSLWGCFAPPCRRRRRRAVAAKAAARGGEDPR